MTLKDDLDFQTGYELFIDNLFAGIKKQNSTIPDDGLDAMLRRNFDQAKFFALYDAICTARTPIQILAASGFSDGRENIEIFSTQELPTVLDVYETWEIDQERKHKHRPSARETIRGEFRKLREQHPDLKNYEIIAKIAAPRLKKRGETRKKDKYERGYNPDNIQKHTLDLRKAGD